MKVQVSAIVCSKSIVFVVKNGNFQLLINRNQEELIGLETTKNQMYVLQKNEKKRKGNKSWL